MTNATTEITMTANKEAVPKKDAPPKKEASGKRDPVSKKDPVVRKEASPKREAAPKKDSHHKSRLHDAFQEEIANTYFRAPSTAKKTAKKKKPSALPWVLVAMAVCLAGALFVSKSNFDIKIKLVNGTPFITKDGAILSPGAQFLVRGGAIEPKLVEKAFFLGDARAASTITDAEATLANSRGQGWASFMVELKKPVDLTKFDVRYIAKGGGGAERVVPIVFDIDNRSYRVTDAAVTTLAGDWQTYIINFAPVKGDIDLANIAALKFEFGSETAGNGPAAVINLKDISIVKTRKVKWL